MLLSNVDSSFCKNKDSQFALRGTGNLAAATASGAVSHTAVDASGPVTFCSKISFSLVARGWFKHNGC